MRHPAEAELRRMLETSLEEVLISHRHLVHVDANERSLTHLLAIEIAGQLTEWDVDCEYNRAGQLPKRLATTTNSTCVRDLDAQTVYPDIIVHHRGTDDNLLVIEAKKANRARSVVDDMEKLHAFLQSRVEGGLGYQFGALVVFDTSPERPSAALEHWLTGLGSF